MNSLVSREASCLRSSIGPVLNSNLSRVDLSLNKDSSETNGNKAPSKSNLFIEPSELKNQFIKSLIPVIFLDCRTAKDFNQVHITNSVHLNCRDKIIKKRLENKKISFVDLINCKETKKKIDSIKNYNTESRSICELFVLYDDKTSDPDELKDNPLKIVQENIKQSGYENDCKILKGGIKIFSECFPEYCTNKTEPKLSLNLVPKLKQQDQACEDIENCKMTEIFPFLYLGNESDAKDLDKLDELGIYHILNVTKNIPFYDQNKEKSKKFFFNRISVNDSTGESLMEHFDEAFYFIDQARKNQSKCIVHCQAGISRSPTIVIAYLMKTQNITMNEAYQKVKNLRSIIAPNLSFLNQLYNYESYLNSLTSFDKIECNKM